MHSADDVYWTTLIKSGDESVFAVSIDSPLPAHSQLAINGIRFKTGSGEKSTSV